MIQSLQKKLLGDKGEREEAEWRVIARMAREAAWTEKALQIGQRTVLKKP